MMEEWKFERISGKSEEIVDTPKMIEVFAVEISPCQASQTLQQFNLHHPLPPHLEHVKRIWRKLATKETTLWLLLGPTEYHLSLEDWQSIVKDKIQSSLTSLVEIITCKVPLRMPRIRDEYERWRKAGHWPTTFHEPRTQIKEEAQELQRISQLSTNIIPMLLDDLVQVAIVDPKTEQTFKVMARPMISPLDTSVMQGIELVAAYQRQVSSSTKLLGSSPDNHHSDHSDYLCTGYYAFCKKEPSLMEAMALVHSRIKIVVFIDADPLRGALHSVAHLQATPGLNHYFSVYRCVASLFDGNSNRNNIR